MSQLDESQVDAMDAGFETMLPDNGRRLPDQDQNNMRVITKYIKKMGVDGWGKDQGEWEGVRGIIFIDFHPFSKIFIEFHDFHRFSSIFMIFIDFHRFSSIFIDFHDFHRFSSISCKSWKLIKLININ